MHLLARMCGAAEQEKQPPVVVGGGSVSKLPGGEQRARERVREQSVGRRRTLRLPSSKVSYFVPPLSRQSAHLAPPLPLNSPVPKPNPTAASDPCLKKRREDGGKSREERGCFRSFWNWPAPSVETAALFHALFRARSHCESREIRASFPQEARIASASTHRDHKPQVLGHGGRHVGQRR